MMKRLMIPVAGAVVLVAGTAFAVVDTDGLVADLQRQGYTYIEVKRGPTQIEVEAIKGSVKIETVYDKATGAVLDQETETASLRDRNRTGVEISDRTRDFEDVNDDGDRFDEDDRDDDDRYDDDDRDDDRDDDDDDRDDDRGDDRDDDDDDDRGGDDRGSN